MAYVQYNVHVQYTLHTVGPQQANKFKLCSPIRDFSGVMK